MRLSQAQFRAVGLRALGVVPVPTSCEHQWVGGGRVSPMGLDRFPTPLRTFGLSSMPHMARVARTTSVADRVLEIRPVALGLDVVGVGARCPAAVSADGVAGQYGGAPYLVTVAVSAFVPGTAGLLPFLLVGRTMAALHEGRAAGGGAGTARALRQAGSYERRKATAPTWSDGPIWVALTRAFYCLRTQDIVSRPPVQPRRPRSTRARPASSMAHTGYSASPVPHRREWPPVQLGALRTEGSVHPPCGARSSVQQPGPRQHGDERDCSHAEHTE